MYVSTSAHCEYSMYTSWLILQFDFNEAQCSANGLKKSMNKIFPHSKYT